MGAVTVGASQEHELSKQNMFLPEGPEGREPGTCPIGPMVNPPLEGGTCGLKHLFGFKG